MATHRESRAIALPAEWLFDIIADVERYPEFLPLMRDARVVKRYLDGYETEQTLALGALMHRFSTRTELARPDGIRIISDDRSFCRFDIRWTFSPLHADHCRVDFALDCITRSLFLMPVVQMLILPMAANMVNAFESRAHALARQAAVSVARQEAEGQSPDRAILEGAPASAGHQAPHSGAQGRP